MSEQKKKAMTMAEFFKMMGVEMPKEYTEEEMKKWVDRHMEGKRDDEQTC